MWSWNPLFTAASLARRELSLAAPGQESPDPGMAGKSAPGGGNKPVPTGAAHRRHDRTAIARNNRYARWRFYVTRQRQMVDGHRKLQKYRGSSLPVVGTIRHQVKA
jgi:hypothetical protein